MPLDGRVLRNLYGVELMFELTADGTIAWAYAMCDMAADARCRNNDPRAIWVANRAAWEDAAHRYRNNKRVSAALARAKNATHGA